MEEKKNPKTESKEDKNRTTQITFRIFQAVFFGVMALGVSSMVGDYGTYVKSPISTFSIMTTIFGLFGSIITGVLANKSKNW